MSNSPDKNSLGGALPRLAELLSELTDGEYSQEIVDEIRTLVADDPEAIELYCDWMNLHAQLYLDLAVGEVGGNLPAAPAAPAQALVAATPRPIEPPRRRRAWPLAAFTALSGACAASLVLLAFQRQPAPQASPPTREIFVSDDAARREFQRNDTRALAVLSRVADVVWAGTTSLAPGAALPAGRVELKSGVVQLEFLSGANLIVEGPADIELISTKLVFCRRGKLRARVPTPAHGFTIETPTHRAVDLGTEFAVDVSPDRATEVHVLDGEIRLQDKASVPADSGRLLRLGSAFRAAADGHGADIKAEAGRFIDAEQLVELVQKDSQSRYADWREYSRRLSQEPDVVAYFNFEDHSPWQRILRYDGPARPQSEGGAIVGCRWAEGRWPHKQALEFKGVEDRVKVFIPGQYDSITLAAWVRIEGFDRFLSSLLLTEGHDVGEVHWQFTDTGKLLLGVKADSEWSQDYYSGVVLKPGDVGRWIHLACVYDADLGIVAHYVDGRRASTEPIRKNVTLRFGAADIGNWVPEVYRDYRIRNLNGRVDEFALFNSVLSDAEIENMYEAGRPNM